MHDNRRKGAAMPVRAAAVAAFLSLFPALASAQQASISGRVTSEGNAPIADARVFLVGTSVGATTNQEGRYTLRATPNGVAEVRVLRVGYREQKKSINIWLLSYSRAFLFALAFDAIDSLALMLESL